MNAFLSGVFAMLVIAVASWAVLDHYNMTSTEAFTSQQGGSVRL